MASVKDCESSIKNCIPERIAVVTGANKGMGLETARQLAVAGVTVVLTARDRQRGEDATSELNQSGLPNVVFHQLDVSDSDSVRSLASFIHSKFGRLDILVNSAAAPGVEVDGERLRDLNMNSDTWYNDNLEEGIMETTYEKAEECFNTNYYGSKRVTEALLPCLELSEFGARIVNVSSSRGALSKIPIERIRKELSDKETLTEEKIDAVLEEFLQDVRENALSEKGWPSFLPAYGISKAALNAYTRILATNYPNMYINCVHPGYVNTDLNWRTGIISAEDGAKNTVNLALLPDGSPTGCYYNLTQLADF